MKTIKILPSVNNLDFCGRVYSNPTVSASGNVMRFDLIRNFGGDKQPVIMSFVMFKPKAGFPDIIKKGAPVIVHAYFTPNTWTDKDGNVHEDVQKVVKRVEAAELIEKKLSDEEAEQAEQDGEDVDIKSE